MNKIFVSNLDEKTQEASLIQYFSQFGNIIECYVSKFPDGKCKGFAKVQLSDKEALKKVLSMNHYMDGRNIRVEQFIKNVKDKKKKERELNSRKICVLAIPLHLKDQDLTNIFKMYGPVDGAYIRKSGGGTKNNHGFVTFKHPRVAQEVKELKFVEIFGGYKLKICDVTKSSNKSEGSVQGHDSPSWNSSHQNYDKYYQNYNNSWRTKPTTTLQNFHHQEGNFNTDQRFFNYNHKNSEFESSKLNHHIENNFTKVNYEGENYESSKALTKNPQEGSISTNILNKKKFTRKDISNFISKMRSEFMPENRMIEYVEKI